MKVVKRTPTPCDRIGHFAKSGVNCEKPGDHSQDRSQHAHKLMYVPDAKSYSLVFPLGLTLQGHVERNARVTRLRLDCLVESVKSNELLRTLRDVAGLKHTASREEIGRLPGSTQFRQSGMMIKLHREVS